LIPDLIFVAQLTKYTGAVNSEFFVAYYLLIALHTYYYQSMRSGLSTAVLATFFYIWFNFPGLSSLHWADLVIRMAFLYLVALSTGFLTLELRQAHNRLRDSVDREKVINYSLDHKLAQITSLHTVSQELGKAETQAQVHNLAVRAAAELLGAPKVYLLRPEGRWLRFVEWIGLDDDLLRGKDIKINDGIAGKVFKSREPQIIEDIQKHQDSAFAELYIRSNLRAVVATPILGENRVLGVLNASRPEPDSFSNEDLNLLGVLSSMVGTALLRTERYESAQRLAVTDPKTNLYNYRYFRALMEEYLTKKLHEKLSLIMLDIDHFKMVNDIYGHQAGDEVLKNVSATISSVVRCMDVVARFGGEEFIALLPDCTIEEAVQVGERIRSQLEHTPIHTSAGDIKVTVSIGAAFGTGSETAEEFISRVDQALYEAKESGRNKVCSA